MSFFFTWLSVTFEMGGYPSCGNMLEPRSFSIVLHRNRTSPGGTFHGGVVWCKFLTAHLCVTSVPMQLPPCPNRAEICFLSCYWMSGISATEEQQYPLEGQKAVVVHTCLNWSPSDWLYWLRVQLQERSWCSNSCLISQEISPRCPILPWISTSSLVVMDSRLLKVL